MNLQGTVSISRVSSNKEDDFIEIRIEDDLSGITFVAAKMSLAKYAELITNRDAEAMLEVRGLDLIGLRREVKTEEVFVPDGPYGKSEQIAAKAIKPFEVDGWEGRVSDAMNHHKRITRDPPKGKRGGWYRVVFDRHVTNTAQEKR